MKMFLVICAIILPFLNDVELKEEKQIEITIEEREAIARVVMNEASTEPFDCKQAIAKVIFNRLEDGSYGETIYDVLHEEGAFSLSNSNGEITEDCYDAVDAALMYPECFPSDMLYFRAGYYHSFGHDYCKIHNTYFSTKNVDYNNLPEYLATEKPINCEHNKPNMYAY